MITRGVDLHDMDPQSFFLWGPRQTGKSTLLRREYPDALYIDLLGAEAFRHFVQQPERLRETCLAQPGRRTVVIDEVQKVPALLDEVHWLIENLGVQAVLCGSSARKVRRGHANLLGGRAARRQLYGLTAHELGDQLDLPRLLNHGYLPSIYLAARPQRSLNAYVADYLKEEIAAEGLVRSLPHFATFLEVAALSDAELVTFATIARECGVSGHTVQGYFEILVDTLQGCWLPSYRKQPKRRVIGAPKFYFADVGTVNFLARRGVLAPRSPLFGKAFENWVMHELAAFNAYRERYAHLAYWRLASGIEVDFVVNDVQVAIEAKASATIRADHLRGLRQLAVDQPQVGRRIVVCLEKTPRTTEDGIEVLPVATFVSALWSGELF